MLLEGEGHMQKLLHFRRTHLITCALHYCARSNLTNKDSDIPLSHTTTALLCM